MSTISYDFSGRGVIVTGAARGIGLELSRFFTRCGARVALIDLDPQALKAAADELGALALVADVSDTESVETAISTASDQFGGLDVLINNAGILRDAVVWKMTDDDWDAVLSTHAGGTFRFTRGCVPHFRARGYGRVINVTSYTGLRGNPGQANYATAKAGIIGFTKTTAKELARFGITVNALSPNARTRMVDSIPDDKRAELEAAIPMGRFGETTEMCHAAGFLASEEAAYITGVVLPVDGGISI